MLSLINTTELLVVGVSLDSTVRDRSALELEDPMTYDESGCAFYLLREVMEHLTLLRSSR
jgi:hypothetical protein